MLKKLAFNVIFAADEDPEFPASELNSHGPTVQGWRSRKNSSVTIPEIILRLQSPGKIYKIQVLAHQHYIPERIELWLHYSVKGAPTTPSSQNFDYLGFIALSDNSSTNFQSRELQSVNVTPRTGTHVKLRFGTPYPNKYNEHGQLGLIAVNILGIDLTEYELSCLQKNQIPNNFTSSTENSETVLSSICDDLSFSMYVEETVAEVIREMESKKTKAVNDERFEYARKLKLCMNVLRQAGERLGRYSLAKRQAVHHEDFTAARLRKEQIEMYRNVVFNQLLVDQLLEKDGQNPENDVCSDLYATKPALPSPPSLQDVASALAEHVLPMSSGSLPKSPKPSENESSEAAAVATNSTTSNMSSSSSTSANNKEKSSVEVPSSPLLNQVGRSPIRGSPNTGSLRRRNKSAPRNSYEDYEERAVPALRHSHTNEFLRECQGISSQENQEPVRGRSKLNDRERRQAALPILIFGNEMIELFYSRQFQDREDGLTRLRSYLRDKESEIFPGGVNKVARASAFLLHRAVRDAVFSVFNQAAETVRSLFIEFIPKGVSPSEVARCVDRLLPELLAKSGDPSARIHTLAQHTILSIAASPEVKDQHLIAPSLSRPVGSGTHPRLALSRMQMLEQLVLSQGISSDKQSGLTCRVLSECGCSGIHHPAESVRKVAERVLLLVYKINPRLVRKQLPPDDDITRRNLLYRQLFTEFDKLDYVRKKEMLETNRNSLGGQQQFETFSPPSVNSSNQSPVELKNRSNRKVTKLSEMDSSPVRFGRARTEQQTLTTHDNLGGVNNCNGNKLNLNHEFLNGKSGSKEGVPPMSRKSSNSDSVSDSNELICPFCEWTCQGDPEQLDRHYWRTCPILTKCPQCGQVLEVSALNFHLPSECEAKISYINCERCTEAVHKELYELHRMEDFCKELATGAAKCPLCHEEVQLQPGNGWKNHLLVEDACLGNSRLRAKM